MTNAASCVLGQVHPVYYPADENTFGTGYDRATAMFDLGYGTKYGFSVADCSGMLYEGKAWRLLQEEWEEVIPDEQRRVERKRKAGLL